MTATADRASANNSQANSRVLAQSVFFPAACLFAALAPWLLLGSLFGWFGPLIDIVTHSRSMLFGFVGALIAGYLGGKLPLGRVAILFSLWLSGRVAEVCSSESLLIVSLHAAFGLYLAVIVVPRFKAAKQWRNRMIAPLLALITCFPLLLWIRSVTEWRPSIPLDALVLLLSLLMFFMAGRFITPLLVRALVAQGTVPQQRVQPRLEGAVMVFLVVASASSALHPGSVWVGVATGLAGLLLLVRLYRWKLFALGWQDADLLALGIGYLWLGLGLLLLGYSLSSGLATTASLHVITVGALGTLSTTIMLKLSSKAVATPAAVYWLAALLLVMATVFRFLANYVPAWQQRFLVLSALLWSVNFAMVTATILVTKRVR
jgi:uncharacterized protein involved in response to NO